MFGGVNLLSPSAVSGVCDPVASCVRLSRCLLDVLVSAVRRLCVPVPVCPVSLGC